MAGYIGTKSVSLSTDAATISGDLTIGGDLSLGDNDKIILGAGSDLEIYHDGSASIIAESGAGDLRMLGNNLKLANADNSANYVHCTNGGAVQLSHNNAAKIATTATGTTTTGVSVATGFSGKIHPVNGTTTNYLSLTDSNELNFYAANNTSQNIHFNYDGGNVDLAGSSLTAFHGGGVTIGTRGSNPADTDASNLIVANSSGASGIQITSASNSVGKFIFGDADNARSGMIYYSHISDFMRFDTIAQERLRLTASGATFTTSVTATSFIGDGSALTGTGHPTTVSTVDPTISVNGTTALGDLWINKVSGECYVCTDITTNANVWKNIGDGTGTVPQFPLLGSSNTIPAESAEAIDDHGSWVGDGYYYITTVNGAKQTYCIKDDNGVYMVIGKFASDACLTVQNTISTSDSTVDDVSGTLWSCNFGNNNLKELRFIGVNSIQGDWRRDRNIDFIHGFTGTENLKTLMAKMGSGTLYGGKHGYPTSYAKDGRGRWHNTAYANHRMSDVTMSVAAGAFTSAGSFFLDNADDAKFTAIDIGTTSGQDATYSVGFGQDDSVIGFNDSWPAIPNNMNGGRAFNTAVYVLMR